MPVNVSITRVDALRCVASIVASVLLAACGGDNPVAISITGSTSRTFTVPAGSQFSVTLQTIGPGEYSSPPALSSSAVEFRDVADVAHTFLPVRHSAFDFSRRVRGARSSRSRTPTGIPWSRIPFWSADSLW